MREASGREIDGKTELSFSSQMGVGGGGGGAGAEKAKLGRLPTALLTPREMGCCGKLQPTRAFGHPPW